MFKKKRFGLHVGGARCKGKKTNAGSITQATKNPDKKLLEKKCQNIFEQKNRIYDKFY